jgi:hypothetical protein
MLIMGILSMRILFTFIGSSREDIVLHRYPTRIENMRSESIRIHTTYMRMLRQSIFYEYDIGAKLMSLTQQGVYGVISTN